MGGERKGVAKYQGILHSWANVAEQHLSKGAKCPVNNELIDGQVKVHFGNAS